MCGEQKQGANVLCREAAERGEQRSSGPKGRASVVILLQLQERLLRDERVLRVRWNRRRLKRSGRQQTRDLVDQLEGADGIHANSFSRCIRSRLGVAETS